MDTKVKFSQMLGRDTQQTLENWTTSQGDAKFSIANHIVSSAGDHMFEYMPHHRVDWGGIWSTGDGHDIIINPGDNIQIDPGMITVPQNVGWGTTAINTSKYPPITDATLDENLNELIKKTEIKNKVDKDLVDTKLPYNIKKDFNDNLIYEFAVAGYTECLTHVTKDGIKIILDDVKYDDLLGDEFEYLCKGMKGGRHEIPLFIDEDIYDINNITKKMKYGVLTIFIPKLSKKSKKMETIIAEDD
jgi:HSP20 family molecular chaperone IbpA